MTLARIPVFALSSATGLLTCLLLVGCSGGASDAPAPVATTASTSASSARPSATASPHASSTPLPTTAGDVFDLAVGDCLNESTGDTVSDVPTIDCSAPHDLEVFYLLTLPDAEVYPPLDELKAAAEAGCRDQFAPYVGVAYDQSALAFTEFSPTETSWAGGDRTVTCVLGDPNGPTTGSAYGIAR